MRTLFLNASKTKYRSLRYAVYVVVLLGLIFGLHQAIEGLLERSLSTAEVMGLVLLVAVAALSANRVHSRRLRSESRNLKDSALW